MNWAERLNRVFRLDIETCHCGGRSRRALPLKAAPNRTKWTATRRILAAPEHRCLKVLYQTPISVIDWIGQTRGPDWRGNE